MAIFSRMLLVLLLGCCLLQSAKAQFNTKTGYIINWVSPSAYNDFLNDFNGQRDWLDDTFNDLNRLQALTLGGRYQVGNFAGELSAIYGFGNTTADGVDPANSLRFFRRLFYRRIGASFGVENFLGDYFSFGLQVQWERFSTRISERSNGNKTQLIGTDLWSNQIFVAFNTPKSKFLSLSLRPFVQMYWKDLDFSPIYTALGGDAGGDGKEDLFSFGIQLIFYNGR
ncbi:MAG: hypothetical protein AAFV25_05535 [Bacteroidota bacterium]